MLHNFALINSFVKNDFLYNINTTEAVPLNKLRLTTDWADLAVVLTSRVYI
jgi:hypothetical protein